jgi:CheY-like chemotaxis protein
MTGSELITVLKNRRDTADLPIIVLAGKKSISDSLGDSRASAVVYKDIDIDDQLDRAVSAIYPEVARH